PVPPVVYASVEAGMATPRLALHQLTRRRHRLGPHLRAVVHCPACHGEIRIVAYRQRTCRVQCRRCDLRFSLDPVAVGEALVANAEAIAEAQVAESELDTREGERINATARLP